MSPRYCSLLYLWFAFISIVLISCNKPQPEAVRLLTAAEQLTDNHPDSALKLIDSIFYPEKSFREKDYMRYWVTRVQVRYKNYLPVHEDTLIFRARDYFTEKPGDAIRTTLAYFYSGCVYREQGNNELAMKHYKDAQTYAAKTYDADLQGLMQYNMGDLLAEEGLYDQARLYYQQAESLYILSPVNAIAKQARCLSAIGRMYLLSEHEDRAFTELHKGLKLAQSSQNSELQSLLAQNLSIAYSEIDQYAEAIEYMQLSFSLNEDSTKIARYYLNFAELYSATDRIDSLTYFTNKLKQVIEASEDPFLKASVYFFLATQAKKENKYDHAFDYQQKYTETIEDISQKRLLQSVYDVQKKYDYEKQQNRYDNQLMNRQRLIILLISFLLLASILSILLLRRLVIQKNRIISLKNAMETLNKTARDLQKRDAITNNQKEQLREILLWKFNVLHKSTLLKTELQKIEKLDSKRTIAKFDKIVYGKDKQSQWIVLANTIDELHPGFPSFIRTTYPLFTETEFKVCLLSYAGLPSKEIALLLDQSVHTVNMARTRIRQKMNLKEPGADFSLFVKQKYAESRLS